MGYGGTYMAVTHQNRRGDTYYLSRRRTEGGRIRYVFSKEPKGELVDTIPEGYEVFEHPTGQVFLRKQVESLFPDEAFHEIEQHMGELFRHEQFILERKRTEVVIHFAEVNPGFVPGSAAVPDAIEELVRRSLEYMPMMRIVYSTDSGEYYVERYCFLGGIDDWVILDGSASARTLVRKYCKHLGKESFYELM